MKNKELAQLKMNAKSLKKVMVVSTLTLMLASSSIPSIAYAVETEETVDSSVSAELEGEQAPTLTEGIPVISTEEVESEIPEKEAETATKEESQVAPETESKATSEETSNTRANTPSVLANERIEEVSTETELTDALLGNVSKIKLLKSISVTKVIYIDKNITIDLNDNLLNVGSQYLYVRAESVRFENGRINGTKAGAGTISSGVTKKNQEIIFNNILFSGTNITNYVTNSYNYIFEGKNEIRSQVNVMKNVLVKKNATLTVVGGGIKFPNTTESGDLILEDNAIVDISTEIPSTNPAYIPVSWARNIDIGENASFTASGKYIIFNSAVPPNGAIIPLNINAKKGSIFNVNSNSKDAKAAVFSKGNYNFTFDHLQHLNMGGSVAQPIFGAGSIGNITIKDSELNVWSIKDSATNGKPNSTWDIKDRFEISNFRDGYRLIYCNNPVVEKEFSQLRDYKRISNGAVTGKPTFAGIQNKIVVQVGTEFNPLNGITATDKIDGDLTDKIVFTVEDGKNIDTSKPGNYTIQYTVKNSNGNEAQAVTELIVEEKKIVQTTISDLDTTSTTVSGLGEPNGLIEVKANQQVIATGTVGSDGKYTIQMPKQSTGVKVTTIVKANNQTSEASTIVKNGEIAKTTISNIDNATTFVSGTGEPNGAITLSANGTILASGKVDSAGKYSFTIAKQAVGVTVLAKVTLNGKESEASTIVTKASEKVVAPVIHDYYITDINAKGTIGGSAKQVAIYVNGVKKRTAAVTNGSFTIYTGDLGLTVAGQSFQIAGLFDGVEGPKTTKIVEARNQLIAPTINDYYTTDANVSGTITGSAKQVAIFIDGVQKRTAAVNNGKYVIYTGDLGLTTLGKKFQVAGIDGIMVGPKTEATVKSKQQLVAPTINEYYTTNVNASGTIGGAAKQVAIFIDGVQKRTAAVKNGKYIIYTGDLGLTTAGKTFEIAGIDGSAIGPKTKMIVKQKEQLVVPKINDYYTTDVNASGTITGSVEKVAIFVDGVQKRTAAVNGGKYVIYTGDLGLTTAGKTFEIAGIAGSAIGPKTKMIVKQKVQLVVPKINDYYTTDVNASGTITGSVEKVAIFVDGVQKRTAAVNGGKYVIYTGDLGLTTAGKKFQIAGISGLTVGPKAEMTVKQKVQLAAPQINPYYTTDTTASGTISGDVEKVAIFVDGVEKRKTTVVDGKYTIYSGDLGLTTAGKVFEIAGVLGLTIGPKTKMVVQQKSQLAPPQINSYYTTDTFVSGTVTGEAERVAIFVDGIQKRTTTVLGGKYTIYSGDLGLTTAGKTFEIAGIKDSIVGMKAKMTVLEKL